MKTLIPFIAAAGLVVVGFSQQPAQPPKPNPEHQKFALWFGDWTYEGQYETTPLGLGGTFTGRMTGRPILDGFGGEYVYVENGPSGETRTVEIDGYDPVAKNYPNIVVGSDGSIAYIPYTMNGNVASWEGTSVISGKRMRDRGTDAVASDGRSFTRKEEICVDGRTWLPFVTMKATKVKAAPTADAAAEQVGIRALFERHRLAIESKNLAGVSQTFDHTGPLVVAVGAGEPMTDWPSIERIYRDWFASADEIHMKDTCLQVRVHPSGLAAWASYLTDETVTSNGLSTTEHLRATFGLEKHGPTWVVVQAHWSLPLNVGR